MPSISPQDMFLLALCIWREARGDGPEGMHAVGWVMMNRLKAGNWGSTLTDVTTDRLQFSAMTSLGDPETILWPNSRCNKADLAAWETAKQIADSLISDNPGEDPTHSALFYYANSIQKPLWAEAMKLTAVIGNQKFFQG